MTTHDHAPTAPTAPTMTTPAASASPDRPASSPAAPRIADAIARLMAEYMPCAGAPQPPTYADWIPAAASWPPELLALHSATFEARRAWAHAVGASEEEGASVAGILAGIAYHALERACRELIAAHVRERLARGELAGASAQEAREWIEEGPTGEGPGSSEEEGAQ